MAQPSKIYPTPESTSGSGLAASTSIQSDKEYREVFDLLDVKEEGCISVYDIGTALRFLHQYPSEETVQKIVAEILESGDKDIEQPVLNYQEFRAIVEEHKKPVSEWAQMILKAFQKFDPNGSGLIESDHLKKVLLNFGETLSEDEVSDMLRVASVSADGMIAYEQFMEKIMSTSAESD